MGSLPTHSKPPKSIPMRKLTATLCLTLTILLGSMGVSAGADFKKGATAAQGGDFATAHREWKPLAEQGDASAQYNQGLMYRDGQGVTQDYETAVEWFRLAAGQGHADAQYNLGFMYALGLGVLNDYVYAHMWVNLAAKNGNELGAKLRDIFEKTMTPAQIAEAQKLARECIRKNYKWCW